jgi:hypothetical protein
LRGMSAHRAFIDVRAVPASERSRVAITSRWNWIAEKAGRKSLRSAGWSASARPVHRFSGNSIWLTTSSRRHRSPWRRPLRSHGGLERWSDNIPWGFPAAMPVGSRALDTGGRPSAHAAISYPNELPANQRREYWSSPLRRAARTTRGAPYGSAILASAAFAESIATAPPRARGHFVGPRYSICLRSGRWAGWTRRCPASLTRAFFRVRVSSVPRSGHNAFS